MRLLLAASVGLDVGSIHEKKMKTSCLKTVVTVYIVYDCQKEIERSTAVEASVTI